MYEDLQASNRNWESILVCIIATATKERKVFDCPDDLNLASPQPGGGL
jgi:hypothetical protein